jgi:UDP-N-acetylmuramyl tripeptide synthase
MNFLILIVAKTISKISKALNLGHGSTWPGQIALTLNPQFIKQILAQSKVKVILVTGTNGKTTTSKLLQSMLETDGKKVILNSSGANLLNGVASSLILNSNLSVKLNADFAIFEVDENVLPLITALIEPEFIIGLNLFRDQLDRYGEIDTIAKKWKDAYAKLVNTTFILNADDPQIAFLGKDLKTVYYFGISDEKFEIKEQQHSADSLLCPRCGQRLSYSAFYFSHLGKWHCNQCGLERPSFKNAIDITYPLRGTYAIYDTEAAALTARLIGLSIKQINTGLKNFQPAFGRQEILEIHSRKVEFFLSKNPTSFNESLRTIHNLEAKNLMIILNDRVPDGTDVSWIWDIDFEILVNKKIKLHLAGDRVYDLALRIKYAGINLENSNIFENLDSGISQALKTCNQNETLFILPTYSAMLDARKILTGKKIL